MAVQIKFAFKKRKFAVNMAKVKKHNLTLEPEYDFDMIGICSHHSDYRLAWGINEAMGLHLSKADEEFATDKLKKHQSSFHSFYEYYDEENMCSYFLIKNVSGNRFLVSEQPKIDYFLFIKEPNSVDASVWLQKLNGISSILAAYSFDPEEFESIQTITL
jgi:hypothetical protein